MASVNKVICPGCLKEFSRTTKQLNTVIRRSGHWTCGGCSSAALNIKRARPVGSTRELKRTGYIEVKTDSGWVRQHIHVMEVHLGRKLGRNEVVHHVNEDKKDNRIDNLEVMSSAKHTELHHIGSKRSDGQKKNIRNGVRGSSRTKLSEEKVVWLKEQARLGLMTQADMAETLSVSPMTVSRAINNQTWN